MQITAAVLTTPNQPFELMPLQLAEPAADEMIVKLSSSGVCHTDIGVQNIQPLPAVLGHEGCGIVEQVGSEVIDHKVGDLVGLSFGSCGSCPNCAKDLTSHCYNALEVNFSGLSPAGATTLSMLDGTPVHGSFFYQSSFATHALVNQDNAVVMPASAEHGLIGPLGCGVQTGAGTILNTLKAEAGSSFVCYGTGAVGLSAIMAAVIADCETIIAVDINPERLELAAELGATHCLLGNDKTLAEIQKLTKGGADYSLDTAGTQQTFHEVIECLHVGGHAALAIIPDWVEPIPFQAAALAVGRTVTGILEGSSVPHTFIPKLYQWYEEGKLPLDKLVSYYPFAEINHAMDDLHHGKVIKPVLLMD